MSTLRPPRHLAPRRRLLGVRRRVVAAVGAAVAVAVGATLLALAVNGPSARGPSAGRPPSASPTAPTAPTASSAAGAPTTAGGTAPSERRGDTTTTGPVQQLRPVPGNLLANGDFEGGLSGWVALGGARIERVAVAHSGAWALRIEPAIEPAGGGAPARLGIASPLEIEARQGHTYHGSAWVRASRPGTEVALTLREQADDGRSSADVIGVSLQDGEWHQVAVVHQLHVAGARLSLELSGGNLRAGDLILVDELGVTAP
jgi:hypothetical protein